MPRRRGGARRVSALTPEVQAAVCELVARGNRSEVAALASGISRDQFYDWQAFGRRGREPYKTFVEALDVARAEAEVSALKLVTRGDVSGQRAKSASAKWWLGRQRSAHYAERQRITIEAETEQLEFLRFIEEKLGTAIYLEILTAWQTRRALAAECSDRPGVAEEPGDAGPRLLGPADVVDTEGEQAL